MVSEYGTGSSGNCSCISGVRLGRKTQIVLVKSITKWLMMLPSTTVTVSAYNDASMLNENLVSQGSANLNAGNPYEVRMIAQDGDDDGKISGLYGTFVFDGSTPTSSIATGTMEFNQLGMRLYSEEYGSESSIRIQNVEGNIWGKI